MTKFEFNALAKRIALHLLYWIVFVIVYPVFFNLIAIRDFTIYPNQLRNLAFGCSYLIVATYFIAYFLIPYLLQKRRKYVLFILCYLFTFLLLTLIDILFTRYFIVPRDYPVLSDIFFSYVFSWSFILNTFLILHTEVFVFISLRYFIYYIKTYYEKQQLKQQFTDAELNMLKGQLHPHFLFNTLNNVYSLAVESSNTKIANSIERISDILRYSLYECNSNLVMLCDEVKIIGDYIELEKLRYSSIDVVTDFPDDCKDTQIMPLVLFTFVENAFKHGTSSAVKNKWIDIKLSITAETLVFLVKNSKYPKNQTDFKKYKEGVGLKNVVKRLDLYYGSENYTLVKRDNENSYDISLSINLNNHR